MRDEETPYTSIVLNALALEKIASVRREEEERRSISAFLDESLEKCLGRWKQRGSVVDTIYRSALYQATSFESQLQNTADYRKVIAAGEMVMHSHGFQYDGSRGKWYHLFSEG